MVSPRRPPTKIYTHSPQAEPVRIGQADLIESDSGNYDLSMANVRSVVTLNHGEVNELNQVAQQAQRLQIAPHDYDHAMIILSPERTQQQHRFDQQPLLLAAASINQLRDEPTEQVSRHVEQESRRQRTQLITPMAEHMAKVEQEIPIFENVSTTQISPIARNRLHEVPHDSGMVSLNTSQASEHPTILNASRTNRLESNEDAHVENLPENDYYRRRLRALDLLRQVDADPNANIQPTQRNSVEIFESTARLPTETFPRERTQLIDDRRPNIRQSAEHTDEPVIYETIEQHVIHRIPPQERLSSSETDDDRPAIHRATENPVDWHRVPPRESQQNQLGDSKDEFTTPLATHQQEQTVQLRSKEEKARPLELPKHPERSVVYNYGKYIERHETLFLIFTSKFTG